MAPAASAARRLGWPTLSFSVITPSPTVVPKYSLPPAAKLKSLIRRLPSVLCACLNNTRAVACALTSACMPAGICAPTSLYGKLSSHPPRPPDRHGNSTAGDEEIAMDIKVGRQAVAEASEKLKNWGRWGKDDHVGTLNQVAPQDIVKAASLIRTGKVFALGIPLDANGPQNGLFGGRFNPIHQMLATGTDAIAGRQDWNRIRYADDTLMLCVQGASHWDALGHVFYEDKAYNGYDARMIDSKGLNVLGIEHSKSKMVGRGVLLDIARFRGVKWMADGESIAN